MTSRPTRPPIIVPINHGMDSGGGTLSATVDAVVCTNTAEVVIAGVVVLGSVMKAVVVDCTGTVVESVVTEMSGTVVDSVGIVVAGGTFGPIDAVSNSIVVELERVDMAMHGIPHVQFDKGHAI